MSILVTGSAGFIGHHVALALLERGERVIGLDNLNDYYDPALKRARNARLQDRADTKAGAKAGNPYRFVAADIADREAMEALVAAEPDITGIVHLAAQAGVRHSMVDPYVYVQSNVLGHVTLLEAARRLPRLAHLAFASSSSVYGLNESLPFRETDRTDRPNSLYAATKRAGELMAHAYGHLYGLPQTALRFFTVYGPWGRPDMAYYGFARAIVEARPVTLYEGQGLARDFTYIDDVVDGVLRVLALPPDASVERLRILNLGNHRSERVSHMVSLLEASLGRRAEIRMVPRPAADLMATFASVEAAGDLAGWHPATSLDIGIPRFVDWFVRYHGIA